MTVYAVITHGDPTTLAFLVRALAPATVVVHVDQRTPLTRYPRGQNVHYVDPRIRVHWAGWSQVQAIMLTYAIALKHVQRADEHVVLLSGQCVPLWPAADIESFLESNRGKQFCKAGLLLDGNPSNENRVLKRWDFDRFDARSRGSRRILNALARRATQALAVDRSRSDFDGTVICAGSSWTALTAECLSGLLSDRGSVERLSRLLSKSLGPDEIFFHSLLYGSSWPEISSMPSPVAKGEARTADYANLHFIDPSLTRFLSIADLSELVGSGAPFARKADLSREPELAAALSDIQWPSQR